MTKKWCSNSFPYTENEIVKVNWGRGVECLFSEGISLNGGAPVHLELDMLMVVIDCEAPGLYAGLDQQVIEGLVAVIVQVVGIHPLSWGGAWWWVGGSWSNQRSHCQVSHKPTTPVRLISQTQRRFCKLSQKEATRHREARSPALVSHHCVFVCPTHGYTCCAFYQRQPIIDNKQMETKKQFSNSLPICKSWNPGKKIRYLHLVCAYLWAEDEMKKLPMSK